MRVDFHDGEEFSWNPLVTVIQHIILGEPHAFLGFGLAQPLVLEAGLRSV